MPTATAKTVRTVLRRRKHTDAQIDLLFIHHAAILAKGVGLHSNADWVAQEIIVEHRAGTRTPHNGDGG